MRRGLLVLAALVGCTQEEGGASRSAPLPVGASAEVPEPSLLPRFAKLRVRSEPGGASVEEDGDEICAATPCDVTYRGEDADGGKEHRLVVRKAGYRGESRTVRLADGEVAVALTPLPAMEKHAARVPARAYDAGPRFYPDDVGDFGSDMTRY